MGKIRFYISLFIAKLLITFLKLTKISEGTSVIGKIVLKLSPDFLIYANDYFKTKINVTGTNGKTTTSGLISHILNKHNSVINNAKGANMLTGVVNALAVSLNPFRLYDYSVIESDEAFLALIYEKYDADYLVVTNLFRDQLDRYGELTATKRLIQNAVDKKQNLKLILNADDPLVASFDAENKIFYGISKVIYADINQSEQSKTEETYNCICGKSLKYSEKFYAQQGHYYCECGYCRPNPKYQAEVTLYKNKSILNINGEEFEINLIGLFNAYNALSAIALAKELGISNINECLKDFKVAFGRSEIKYINKKQCLIQLIKNPIGANEVLKTIDLDSNILIAINDNYADGRDVSWLWDAEFERLADIKKDIVVSGERACDMALRLKYAGIPAKKIVVIKDIKKAIKTTENIANGSITILPTYTALLKINKFSFLKSKI